VKLFGPLYDRVMQWSRHRHAPRYLAALSFAESSFFPVPPDVMLAPMAAARPQRSACLALITTLFSVLGGLLGYLIGWLAFGLVEPWVVAAGYGERMAMARDWFDVWGVWVILVAGFSPVPYKLFTLTAGALSMALLPFVVASLVGRGARFFALALLIAWMGPRIGPRLRPYMEWFGWFTVLLLVVAAVIYQLQG
jgi:membrane protein YqaA with SNARE-associated domain